MNVLFDAGMVIGPVIGYIYQYKLIRSKQSVGTFSIDVCGILLFANITRLNFYIFKKYEPALFLQSLLMIMVQLLLLKLCSSFTLTDASPSIEQLETVQDHDELVGRTFWRWKHFNSYLLCVGAFAFGLFALSTLLYFLQLWVYGELIGLVALLSQSILIAPQIVKNFRMKKVKGLSHLLILLNWSGDIIKLTYFLIKVQPFQFIMCGVIQIILDSTVIMQTVYYRSKQKLKLKRRQSVQHQPQIKSESEQISSYSIASRQIALRISQIQTIEEINAKGEEVIEEIQNSSSSSSPDNKSNQEEKINQEGEN